MHSLLMTEKPVYGTQLIKNEQNNDILFFVETAHKCPTDMENIQVP